ncbi:MAG: FliM/FliN family flagellar motor switch protein, partial [Gammaproteobacteria bacterium]|nr:FliM/FliN family flagellar motor switch protein [Gammaproteobacteria bacterium]
LKEEILTVDVPINAVVAEAELTLREIRELSVGDIIPVEMPKEITLTANGIPAFRTKLGVSNGNVALKVTNNIPRAKEEDRKFKFGKPQ